nr:MAG TPA: tail spike protein [Bacteriophage sp.]
MMENQQLIKKDRSANSYSKIFPWTFTDLVLDRVTKESLDNILVRNNFIALPYVGSKAATRLQVPMKNRRRGIWLSYIDYAGTLTVEYYNDNNLDDNHWQDSSYWLPYNTAEFQPASVGLSALAQEVFDWINSQITTAVKLNPEDLQKNSSGQIEEANRAYDTSTFSGLGYRILRKNIQSNKNILTQSMINMPNTIYEIRYDFDLNGNTINIPDSCELKFVGGSLKNGILDGNFTISSNKYNILIDIIAKGILNEEIPIEWFGGKAYSYWEDVQNGVDSNSALENAIQSNGSRIITFNEGYYKITKTINLPPYITIKGNAVNSKYYNIRRTSTPNVPLSSKIYFNSEDEVLFNINNNYISIEDISLHGTRSSDAIHLIDSGYSIKLKNVQIYVWRYGIYRVWDHILRTGFSGSIIDNCSFTELTGGIFIDYDESNAGSELYFITSNDIRNTTFTVCKAFGVYYKSNYSISNNIFKACTFSKIGYGNYELDLYNTFGCYAIKIESFQKSTVNGGNKVESCYFEDIIPYRTGSIVTGETALSNGYIIPTDDTKYSTGIFYNCNIELDTTYYTNILKFFRIDNNTSISIGNARIYSFNTIFNNNVWKYTRLIYHEHSNIVPNYLNQSIVYNNNWRIATTSPLTGLVSYTLYNDRFNALVINQLEDRFTDYPPYVIESASNILSTRQVTGNTIQIDCVCTTSSIESTYIEGYIVYQEKYCKFSIVVDNINASAKFYAVEDSGYQGYGINVKYKKKSDTSFSLYISKTGIKYTIIPIRTSIVSQFKLTAINSSNIPEDSLDVIKLLKVNAISNLPTLNNNFVGYQTYDPNMKLPLFWNGLEWANSDGSLTSKVNTVFTTSEIIYPSRVYKIVSDIDLGGITLTLPTNCTLDFQGGSFSNGTITFSNTTIVANSSNYIFKNIIFKGSLKCSDFYVDWVGASASNEDNSDFIKQAVIVSSTFRVPIVFNSVIYNITKPIILDTLINNVTIKGNKAGIQKVNSITTDITEAVPTYGGNVNINYACIFCITEGHYWTIRDLAFYGGTTEAYNNYGIFIIKGSNFLIENVGFTYCSIAMYVFGLWMSNFTKITCTDVNIGFNFNSARLNDIVGNSGTSICFNNCYVNRCNTGFNLKWLNYSVLNSCAVDYATTNAYTYADKSCVTMNGCGSEASKSWISLLSNSNVVLNACQFLSTTAENTSTVVLFNSKILFNNCAFQDYVTKAIFTNKESNITLIDTDVSITDTTLVFNISGVYYIKLKNKVYIITYNGKRIENIIDYSNLLKGTTDNRPILASINEGFEYYDTTLKKMILWNGTAWTNLDGTALT